MNGPSSDALRMRRVRRHNKGDHSLCAARTCAVLRQAAPAEPADEPNGIELMTRTFVDSLGFAAGDPRALMSEVAVKLAGLLDRDQGVASAARELRVLIAQLVELPNQAAGPVDELRARRAARRLDQLVALAAQEGSGSVR